MRRLVALLFPDPPRAFPGRRGLKIVLRAVHVLCAGILVGAYLFAVDSAVRTDWLVGTLATGTLLLLLDLHETAAFLLQVRGVVLVGKLSALAALPWCGDAKPWVLGGIVLVSVVSSHAPGYVRHRVLAGAGRVTGATSQG